MKNILLTTDFSENSMKTAMQALQFFDTEKDHFYLLNIFPLPSSNYEMLVSVEDILRKNSEKKLAEEISKLRTRFTHLNGNIELISRSGSLKENLLKIIEEKNINLVVLGADNNNPEVKKENHSLNLMDDLHCPLMVIPKN